MYVIGVDAHKRSHTAVIVNEVGARLGVLNVKADSDGHRELVAWARSFGEVRWALEDCRNMTRRLESDLLGAGEGVVRVPPKLMAHARDAARTYGKSDPIDALAVARAALREPDLPLAVLDGPDREVRLLVSHREALIARRVSTTSRLRWHLLDLDREWDPARSEFTTLKGAAALVEALRQFSGTMALIALEMAEDIHACLVRENELERRVAALTAERSPGLRTIVGCGALTAAKIVGETGGAGRFKSRDAYAVHCGTAPVPVWSANNTRHRLSRMGNRQLNTAIHRIAVTQLRWHPPAQALVDRAIARGKSKSEAMRILKRHITNAVFRQLLSDLQHQLVPAPQVLTVAA